MKRTFSFAGMREPALITSGAGLIAACYGLVRLAFGLFLPDIQAELSIATSTAGLISAGASVVYCLGAIVGFFLAGRRTRSLLVAAAAAAGLGAAGMASAMSPSTFSVFAILSSAGAGLASPGLVDLIRRNVRNETNNSAQAIVNAGVGPGLIIAGVLALFLLPDWRLAWYIVAALTAIILGALLLLDRGARSQMVGSNLPRIPPLVWYRKHLDVMVAAFFLGAGSAAVWNFGRTHLVAAGSSGEVSVTAWVALGMGGAAVMATSPMMSRVRPRAAWTITSCTVAVSSLVLGLAPAVAPVALVACAVFGWGYTAATGALITWTAHLDTIRAPAGTSLLFVILILGQAAGAAFLGSLVTPTGFLWAFLVANTLSLAAAAVPYFRHIGLHQRSEPRSGVSL